MWCFFALHWQQTKSKTMTCTRSLYACFFVICCVKNSVGQTRDSIPPKALAYVTDKFPATRILNIEYSQVAPYRFQPRLYGSTLPDQKMQDFQQWRLNVNLPFFRTTRWIAGVAGTYRNLEMGTQQPVISGVPMRYDFQYHTESVYVTYFSKLFGKTAMYTALFAADGSQHRFERLRGNLTGTLVLNANAQTKMLLGLAVFADPSTRIPAIPIFSYEHRFSGGWITEITLPKKVLLKKDLFENGRLSLGSEMDNTNFYYYAAGKTYEYRQLEINSGLVYEHYFGALIATVKTGLRSVPNGRLFEKSDNPNDYVFQAKPQGALYVNLGISFNPFQKKQKPKH